MEQDRNKFAVGWAAFSGITMFMAGFWWLIAGFAALFGDGSLFVTTSEWTFKMTSSTWGLIHILLGALLLAAGINIFRGAGWARLLGVLIAMIGGIAAFAWLPYYPIWAIIHIAVSIAVIWALTVHGHDLAG